MNNKNLLINLPADFFRVAALQSTFAAAEELGEVRRVSHDTPAQIEEDLAWADAVIMWSWPSLDQRQLADAGPLEYMGHIDLAAPMAAAELACGIPVSLAKGGWSPAVAEMALGLILVGLRRISEYHCAMKSGREKWVERFPADVDPRERELTGLSVGLVGFGRIGRRLAELLSPFSVDLRVCDPYVAPEVIKAHGGRAVEADELVMASDVVVLCAAATAEARAFLDARRIGLLRPDAVLVNVSRASLVDMPSLIERLERGDLIAALDVFEVEPLSLESSLRACPNVLLTPHRAGGILPSVRRAISWLIDDYRRLLAGQPRQFAFAESMLFSLDSA